MVLLVLLLIPHYGSRSAIVQCGSSKEDCWVEMNNENWQGRKFMQNIHNPLGNNIFFCLKIDRRIVMMTIINRKPH